MLLLSQSIRNLSNIKRNLLKPNIDLPEIEVKEASVHGVSYKKYGKWILPVEECLSVLISISTYEWDHVACDAEQLQRCPTYTEMAQLKEMFWPDKNQLALQIHPAHSDYVNIKKFRLHLWRSADISERVEKTLKKKTLDTYAKYKALYTGKKQTILCEDSSGSKFVVIFGGTSWPTWEEVCKIKQQYWQPEEVAIQFNISQEVDLNDQYMIILWDGADFSCPSPDEV